MRVTSVRIIKTKGVGKIKAFADVTFDDVLTVKGWKIIDGAKGRFVAPPSTQDKNDQTKYYDNILFVGAQQDGSAGQEMRTALQAAVLRAYDTENGGTSTQTRPQAARPGNRPVFDDEVPF